MFSFKVRWVHQIEMTSICNLRCRYCPHPHMGRPKVHMTAEAYAAALGWAKHFIERNIEQTTYRELNLAGIGESTMHPEFARNVFLAREAVGDQVELILATNGLLMTKELAREIAPSRIKVWVSLHRPEKAGPAVEALRAAGIFAGVSSDPSVAAIDWAGQVPWTVSVVKGRPCPWVLGGRVVVLADGRVSRCCLDAEGVGVLGSIDGDLEQMRTSPYVLCRTCDQDVGVEMEKEEAA
jgi:hypothetical protein